MTTTKTDADLHAFLRTQFTDLAGAKAFMWRWVNDLDQELSEFGLISARAMAGHCSAVLEGGETKSIGPQTNYMASKYGPELYTSAWGAMPASA